MCFILVSKFAFFLIVILFLFWFILIFLNFSYYNNFAGFFADIRGGWTFTTGQLSVISPAVAGIYAYSGQSSFVNTFILNGVTSTDLMTVKCTYNTGRSYSAYADAVIQPSACSSANNAVATAAPVSTGCSVTLSQSGGSSSNSITASYNNFSAVVAYRSYYFIGFTVNSTRVQLRRLGCDFETAFLTAYARLTLDGITTLSLIDLSNIVSFSSSNPAIISITGRLAKGVALGNCTISYGAGVASSVLPVVNATAVVRTLVTYAYTSVTVTPTTVSGAELVITFVQILPKLSLTSELQTASLVTYVITFIYSLYINFFFFFFFLNNF